jgi:pimeloyl-ACP methyl ester carboxylesterase
MLQKMFAVLLVAVLLLFVLPASAAEWQASTVVRLQEKKPKFDRQETIAGGQLIVTGKTFTVLIDQYPELIGTAYGKKLRVSSTPEMLDWMNQVLPRFGDENLVVKKVTGSGLSGTRWALKLNFTANTMSGDTVRGTLQIGALRTKILSSAKVTVPVDGSLVVLKTGETVSFDSGFFAQPGGVEVWVQRDSLSKSLDVAVVSDTTIISFPYAALAVSGDTGLVIHRNAQGAIKKSWEVKSLEQNEYLVARITLSAESEQIVLYGKYGRDLKVSREAFELLQTSTANSSLQIEICDVDLRAVLGGEVSLELFRWDENNQNFVIVPNWEVISPPAGEQVVVLLHGWQAKGESATKEPHLEVWTPLLTWATGPGKGNSRWSRDAATFEFYSVRYNTEKSVFDNAVLIQNALAKAFKGRPIVILAHSMGGLVSHVMYQRYHPTLTDPYLPWDSGGGILRLVTLGTPFHGSPLVQIASDYVGCGFLGPDEVLVDVSESRLKLETPGALSLRWDQLDGRQVGSPNVELAQLNAVLPAFIPEYRTFAGVLSSEDHSLKYRGGNGRMKSCYAAHASDGVVPEISAHCKAFVGGQSIVRSTEVSMSGPGYGTDFDHTQLWEGRFGNDADPVHFSTILDQLNLRTPYQLNSGGEKDSYSSPGFDLGFETTPTSMLIYARNSGYKAPRYPVKIVCANGDQRIEDLDVEVEVVQSGSGGWGKNEIKYIDTSGAEVSIWSSTQPEKTVLKLKTNFKYGIVVEVNAGTTKFQNELKFRFPTR